MEDLLVLVLFLLRLVFKAVVGIVKLGLLLGFGISFDKKEEEQLASFESYDENEQAALDTNVLLARFEELLAASKEMRASIEWDRANHGLQSVLDDHVTPECLRWITHLREAGQFYDLAADYAVDELDVIIGEIHILVSQRKSSDLRQDLGDADAMAMACYRPLAEFARANRVQLTTTFPMVQLSNFELSTWTAFVPTGVAPIFLPPDYFRRLAWWPALAHEIGHDFLAATKNVDWQIRQQLGLPSAEEGRAFLRFGQEGLAYSEVARLFGGWLEEIFCDLFATMMLGPAYGWTMIELFSGSTDDVTRAPIDGGTFAPHPPRHLRLLNCAHLLAYMGHKSDADELLEAWGHQGAEDLTLRTQFGEAVGLPIELMVTMSQDLVIALYTTQLDAFAGPSLESLPGVDYGPHEAAETKRATESFLARRLPETKSAHRIIAGAVMAWHEEPHREAEFLRRCRVAIVGEAEWAEPGLAATLGRGVGQASGPTSIRDAFILSTILGPPVGRRGASRRRSFGQRVGR